MNKKISELDYLSSARNEDLIAIVDTSAGTFSTKKITGGALRDSLLLATGSNEIHVDAGRTDSYVADGSQYRPYKTLSAAFSSVGSASNQSEFNLTSKRQYRFVVHPGTYEESGPLVVPARPRIVLDLSSGASVVGNLSWTAPDVFSESTSESIFAIVGTGEFPSNSNATFCGVVGDVSILPDGGPLELHLVGAGIRGRMTCSLTPSSSSSSSDSRTHEVGIFCWENSTFGSLNSKSVRTRLYMSGVPSAGSVIGEVGIVSMSESLFGPEASVFPTIRSDMTLRGVKLPPYLELRPTSFSRSSGVATMTLPNDHGLSSTSGFEYVLVSGCSESPLFNTPACGARIVSYPAPNSISYENPGTDVLIVIASSSKAIKGCYLNSSGSLDADSDTVSLSGASLWTHDGWSALSSAAGVAFHLPSSWVAGKVYHKGEIVTPGNGYQYRASGNIGVSGATQPQWPTGEGSFVVDGSVSWNREKSGFLTGLQANDLQKAVENLHDSSNILYEGNLSVKDAIGSLRSTVPLSASSRGEKGQIAVDSDYLYVCVATDSWKKIPLQSF